jgi:predicted nucleotidyltransferase
VRITQQQADILKSIAADVFGVQASLQLFGSRTDDARRGRDIDLYVKGFNQNQEKALDAKLRFLVKAKRVLGEQRINLVFAPAMGQRNSPFSVLRNRQLFRYE